MSAPFLLSEHMNLVAALALGVFFGFFLERGGLGNPHKLTGVFYLTDFAVPKAMFTAILVAATGLYLLSDLKLIDLARVWIIPTVFWPQLAGGGDVNVLWWALALGACLGGNGTLVGASANLTVAGLAERQGVPFKFLAYTRIAFPVMLLSIVIAQVYMYLRYF